MRVPWKWLCLALPASLLVACEQDRSPTATATLRTSLAADYTNNPDGGGPYIARYETDQYYGFFDSDDGLVRAFFTTFPLDSALPWVWNSGVCGPPGISAVHFQLISHWDSTFTDPSQLYLDKAHGSVWIALVSRAPGAFGPCGGRPLIASGWGKMAYIDNNASYVPNVPGRGARTQDAWSFQVLGNGTTPAGAPVKLHAQLACVANPGSKAAPVCHTRITEKAVGQGDSAAAAAFPIADLGTLGGANSEARAINDGGWVVGTSDVFQPGVTHAFLWKDGRMTDLGTLGGTSSRAFGINNGGEIVGSSQVAGDAAWHAFRWVRGTMTDLGGLGGSYSEGFVINDAGDVTGYAAGPGSGHAALWRHGTITDLGTLGGNLSWSNGITSSGAVVGGATLAGDFAQHAFLWRGGMMTDLGTLGGTSSGASYINGAGVVVGGSQVAGDWIERAFLWRGGRMSELPNLGGYYDYAQWINDGGQAVGGSCTWWSCDAVLWDGGTVTDLGMLPGAFGGSWAQSINSRGQVVGRSYTTTGQQHAVLWVTR